MTPSMPTRELQFKHARAVVPADAGVIRLTRALYVGGAGNVRVLMASGQDVTFAGVVAGTVLSIAVTRVFATNTTATNILGLYLQP